MVIDNSQTVNQFTFLDAYPLPCIDKLTHQLIQCRICCDLCKPNILSIILYFLLYLSYEILNYPFLTFRFCSMAILCLTVSNSELSEHWLMFFIYSHMTEPFNREKVGDKILYDIIALLCIRDIFKLYS